MLDLSSSPWPDPTQPAIIAPGPHRSYLDGPTLALMTPHPILFAVTPDFALHPLWRPILLGIGAVRGCSMVPMRPGSTRGIRVLLRHLEAGGWVCVFPEGGIDRDGELAGVGWLSARSGVPVHRIHLRHGCGHGSVKPVISFAKCSQEF